MRFRSPSPFLISCNSFGASSIASSFRSSSTCPFSNYSVLNRLIVPRLEEFLKNISAIRLYVKVLNSSGRIPWRFSWNFSSKYSIMRFLRASNTLGFGSEFAAVVFNNCLRLLPARLSFVRSNFIWPSNAEMSTLLKRTNFTLQKSVDEGIQLIQHVPN